MLNFEVITAATQHDLTLPDLVEEAIVGPLASAGLEVRPAQIRMARGVAEAIEHKDQLLCEMPCGGGKGIAYLIAGVLGVIRARAHGQGQARLVVSTSSIALQRQLVQHDIPILEKALGIGISASVLKGKANFVCLDRLETEAQLQSGPHHETAKRIKDWIGNGGSGDKEDLPFPVVPAHWGAVSVGSDECLGKPCPHFSTCLSENAKRSALQAAVVVVNHAFLARAGAGLARNAVAVICDEGHDLEDALRRTGGAHVGIGAPKHWARIVKTHTGDEGLALAVDQELRSMLASASALLGSQNAARLSAGWTPPGVVSVVQQAARALQARADIEADPVLQARIQKHAEGALNLGAKIANMSDADPVKNGRVAWAERDRNQLQVHYAHLRPRLPAGTALVLCSATLAVGGQLSPVARNLGLRNARELILPSPWPLEQMAVVVAHAGAPDPKDPGRDAWADDAAVDFVRRCGGGVLVLAGSHARAQAMGEHLRAIVPWAVRIQGEAGRTELLEWFARDTDGVLVGTRSMFQGVDIPGDALRGVLIDRVPFPSPGDPVEEAIGDVLRKEGKDPFRERSLGVAAAILRQGVGRLIRSSSDKGAVCILDGRFLVSSFSATLQRAVYPIPISTDLGDIDRALRGERVQGTIGQQSLLPVSRSIRRKNAAPSTGSDVDPCGESGEVSG